VRSHRFRERIGPSAKRLDSVQILAGGEVIRFEVGNKSFVWNFNGQRSSFDLARVAPTSVLDHKVTAYVASNPMYPRRR
jgi:hypothetical protein